MSQKRAVIPFTVGAVLLCAFATGCGSAAPAAQPGKSPAPPPPTTSYSSLFTTTATTPTPAPKPPPITTLPAASDGTNLKACRDGRCEVRIGSHAAFNVNAHGEAVAFDISIDQGLLTMGIGGVRSVSTDGDGDSQASFDGNGMSVSGHSGLRVTADKVIVEALAVLGSEAVIRLSLT